MKSFSKNILSIHAHPDDTEAFCSGTLALLKVQGYHITIATMTAGGMGGINSTEEETIALRELEAKKAASELGADYICLKGKDGFLYDTEELRLKTLELIRETQAGIVITHLPFDYHSDHRVTCQIVEAAAMIATLPNAPVKAKPLDITPLLYHSAPLGFSEPLGQAITPPHFFIDISSVIETKMSMLSHHHTQIELMKVMHKMDNFFEEMKQYNIDLGKLVNVQYAECMWQHLGGGFQKDPFIQNELQSFLKKANS